MGRELRRAAGRANVAFQPRMQRHTKTRWKCRKIGRAPPSSGGSLAPGPMSTRRESFLQRVRAVAFLTLASGFLSFGTAGAAEEIQHLSITLPGGMPGLPVMGPIQQVSNGISVTWFGPAGYYQLLEKASVTATNWRPVGGLRLTNQAILNSNHASSFFQVLGPNASYGGS